MIATPEIICDLFSFLDKDQIERIQLVNQFWNNVVIRHKNILPLRKFDNIEFHCNKIYVIKDSSLKLNYKIKFDATKLNRFYGRKSSRYSHLTVDEVLNSLNDVVFDMIRMEYYDSVDRQNYLLNMMKLVTMKTGGRLRGRYGQFFGVRFDSKLDEILDNYIIVDELTMTLGVSLDSYIREVCANPEIVQLPSTPKEIRLSNLKFKENEKILHFTCNGKLNGANRLTIEFEASNTNYGNLIRQWFEVYLVHQNPISLVGRFVLRTYANIVDSVFDAVKTLLNNTQLRVKYSLETKKYHKSFYISTYRYLKRSCVLHETDSYALVIEMEYGRVAKMSSINASDLDQPPCNKMYEISFCVK